MASRRIRGHLPLALLAICLVLSATDLWKRVTSFDASNVSKDMVSSWEQRMQVVRGALPPDITAVGYMDEGSLRGGTLGLDTPEFFMTQYGLAPVVVRLDAREDWIIGNFGSSLDVKAITSWLRTKYPRYAAKDLGFGIYLIHRSGR
jgi:hypothetical protein